MTTMSEIEKSVPLWFAPGAMRFFSSRIESDAIEGPGGIYFITSEQFDEFFPRLYSVRKVVSEGPHGEHKIETHPAFQAFKDKDEATAWAVQLAKGEPLEDSCPYCYTTDNHTASNGICQEYDPITR